MQDDIRNKIYLLVKELDKTFNKLFVDEEFSDAFSIGISSLCVFTAAFIDNILKKSNHDDKLELLEDMIRQIKHTLNSCNKPTKLTGKNRYN